MSLAEQAKLMGLQREIGANGGKCTTAVGRTETLRDQMESVQEVADNCNQLAQQIAYALFGAGAAPCNPTSDTLSIRERLNLAHGDMADCRGTLREILERLGG